MQQDSENLHDKKYIILLKQKKFFYVQLQKKLQLFI